MKPSTLSKAFGKGLIQPHSRLFQGSCKVISLEDGVYCTALHYMLILIAKNVIKKPATFQTKNKSKINREASVELCISQVRDDCVNNGHRFSC